MAVIFLPSRASGRFQLRGDQGGQFFQALPQRRDQQRQAVQAMKKILAKLSLRHALAERAIGRADNAHIARSMRSEPRRSNSPYSSTRKIFTCASALISEISSRKSVPP